MGCVVLVCSKRLWQNAPSILLHKSTGNFVVVKLQLWHHSVSAAVVTRQPSCPIILLSVRLETTHLRHATRDTVRSPAWTGRDVLPASAGVAAWEFAAYSSSSKEHTTRAYQVLVNYHADGQTFKFRPRPAQEFQFQFLFFNTRTQSDCACRGHGQACLDRRILLVSQTVV